VRAALRLVSHLRRRLVDSSRDRDGSR